MDDFIFFATLHIIWILKRITFIRSIIFWLIHDFHFEKNQKDIKTTFSVTKLHLNIQYSLRQYQKQPDILIQVGL